jgi:hypothetical protein
MSVTDLGSYNWRYIQAFSMSHTVPVRPVYVHHSLCREPYVSKSPVCLTKSLVWRFWLLATVAFLCLFHTNIYETRNIYIFKKCRC